MYSSLAAFILIVIPSVCKGLHNCTCNVVPKAKYIEEGSDTEVMCQTSCVRSKIFWTLKSIRLNESLANTINSSHIVLSLRNFTYSKATLQCHTADTERILGGTIIRSYSRPRNISCMLYYNDEYRGVPDGIRCNWEHQIDSSSENRQKIGNINYTVQMNSSTQSEICNSQDTTTCKSEYHDIDAKIPLSNIFTVTVRAKTAVWETFSGVYTFDPFKIWQIPKPKLDVTATSDHILVTWKIPSPLGRYDCQVKYRKTVNEATPVTVLTKTLDERKNVEIIIEDVDSCSHYTIAARWALEDAPWSVWSQEKTVWTKLKRSHVRLRPWRVVSEAGKNGMRKVHIMWMEIPSTCRETLNYTIKHTGLMTGVNHTVTSCGSSSCDVDVNQEAHTINIRASNDEFLPLEESVYVPGINENLPRVTDIQTSTREGVILVSWEAPLQPVDGYMVDYTHNGNQYYWKETKYTNATLFDLLDKKPYNITVTPLFDSKTGHGTTVHQICSRVGDPGNVTINVLVRDKSAVVSWTVKSQEECSGVIVNYTVFYSGVLEGPQLNVTVNGTRQDFDLKDLNPDTQYSVYVKATAPTGSTESSKRFFTTKRFDPRLVMALGICGSILIILVLSFGLCCAVQWNKFKEKPVPNPGHSSLAWWPSTSDEKGICSFQPILNPAESPCDSIYTEKAQRMSVSSLASRCNDNPAIDHTEEYVDPAAVPAPQIQKQDPVELAGTQNSSCPEECTDLLPSQSVLSSPYRSQTSVEAPAPRAVKQCKQVPAKQQEKMPPVMVYVTLDMFE